MPKNTVYQNHLSPRIIPNAYQHSSLVYQICLPVLSISPDYQPCLPDCLQYQSCLLSASPVYLLCLLAYLICTLTWLRIGLSWLAHRKVAPLLSGVPPPPFPLPFPPSPLSPSPPFFTSTFSVHLLYSPLFLLLLFHLLLFTFFLPFFPLPSYLRNPPFSLPPSLFPLPLLPFLSSFSPLNPYSQQLTLFLINLPF